MTTATMYKNTMTKEEARGLTPEWCRKSNKPIAYSVMHRVLRKQLFIPSNDCLIKIIIKAKHK